LLIVGASPVGDKFRFLEMKEETNGEKKYESRVVELSIADS
jgi:hypothetical protein